MAAHVERLEPRLWRTVARDGRVFLLRPIRPEDAPALQRAYAEQDADDREMRLLSKLAQLPDRMARRFCTVDEERDVCLVIVPEDDPQRLMGGARLMRDRSGDGAEFAVSLSSSLKGQGLGRRALETVLEVGPEIGVKRTWGSISRKNEPMRALAAKLGMTERPDPDDHALVIAEKPLAALVG